MAKDTIRIANSRKAALDIVSGEFDAAAEILAEYLHRVTDARFTVRADNGERSAIRLVRADHGDSGFAYRLAGGDVVIEAGNAQAMNYAVYDWLERVVGCRYYSRSYEYIPFDANLEVAFDDYAFSPILGYREILYTEYGDPIFAEKHKITPTCKKSEHWGFWCHSFDSLCPPDKYFDTHPEYFALRDGKRQRENTQLCLSNPDVLEIVCENLAKFIEKKPDALYWSVSQNDNANFCECEKCRALDEHDGSHIGSVLNFVNKVAARFPDKIISTLAYWYTRQAPKYTRPADNVHIMLCNIEANRGMPIESDPRSQDSKNELLDWKQICGNVFLWDYCIQFRNLVSPFPNLRVLGPNIRFFVENNVRSLFSQCNREIGGEFYELRGYMLAKLMWNPYIDERVVMEDFVFGYYKQAGRYVLEYIDLIHNEMERAGGELRIFGSPEDARETYMREELYNRYESLFDTAIEATAADPDTNFRVHDAALPVWYAGILLGYGDEAKRAARVERFREQAKRSGLTMVEEWTITVDKFLAEHCQ